MGDAKTMTEATSSLAVYQAAALELCFVRTPTDAHFVALDGPRERWLIYREMTRTRLATMIRSGVRRTIQRLSRPTIDELIVRFFHEVAVHSVYMRDCVTEFAEFALNEPELASDAVAKATLRVDACRWRVRDHAAQVQPASPFDFQQVPIVNPTAIVLELLAPPLAAGTAAHSRDGQHDAPVLLTVFRDSRHRVHQLTMTPFTHDLLSAWRDATGPAIDAATASASASGIDIDGTFVDRMCDALALFLEHELVLGSAPRD